MFLRGFQQSHHQSELCISRSHMLVCMLCIVNVYVLSASVFYVFYVCLNTKEKKDQLNYRYMLRLYRWQYSALTMDSSRGKKERKKCNFREDLMSGSD